MKYGILLFVVFYCCKMSGQCPPLGPIIGEATPQWCHNPPYYLDYPYTIPNSADADLVWSLIVIGPYIADFLGPNTGDTVYVSMDFTEEPFTLCATPTNPCYDPTPICLYIDPLPSEWPDPTPDITVCQGDNVDINLNGPGDYISWYVYTPPSPPTPFIGIQPSGTDEIHFTAVNNYNTQIQNSIYYFPVNNNCNGQWAWFDITVNPSPIINPTSDITVCGGESVDIPLVGTPGATYEWTNDNPNIGLPAVGTGNISVTMANPTSIEIANITVNANFEGCPTTPESFQITVEPTPFVDPPPNLTLCAGEPLSVAFGDGPPGTVFQWTNSNPAIGLPASGSGDINLGTPQVGQVTDAVISVTPVLGNCTGQTQTFSVRLKPTPELNPVPDVAVCALEPVAVNFGVIPPSAELSWTNSNPAIGLPGFGFGDISFSGAAVQQTQTGLITVSPQLNGCAGEQVVFQIAVQKCCETLAGNMDTLGAAVCSDNPLLATFLGGYSLETGDTLHFILFSDPDDPIGSVLYESDTLLFPFLPGITVLDSTFYVAAIAGNQLAGDSIDRADPCIDVSNAQPLRWLSKPSISLVSTNHEVCAEGCFEATFAFVGRAPYQFDWVLEQGGQVLYSRSETAMSDTLTIEVCTQDFDVPYTGGNLGFRVTGLMDALCGCGD